MAVKEFWKSVHICQSYDKKSSVLFFLRHSVVVGLIVAGCCARLQHVSCLLMTTELHCAMHCCASDKNCFQQLSSEKSDANTSEVIEPNIFASALKWRLPSEGRWTFTTAVLSVTNFVIFLPTNLSEGFAYQWIYWLWHLPDAFSPQISCYARHYTLLWYHYVGLPWIISAPLPNSVIYTCSYFVRPTVNCF